MPRRIGETEVAHKLMLKNEQDNLRSHTYNRGRRIASALKTEAVATPLFCVPVMHRDGPLEFAVGHGLYSRMPEGTDNSPTTAELAADRAVRKLHHEG